MFESIMNFFKKMGKKKEAEQPTNSRETAKERLHLVLMQDRANVSADFLELMKQEIIEVIKKYIEVDENAIDVRLTNKENEDGTNGAPALYANIPILNIKNEARQVDSQELEQEEKEEQNQEEQTTTQEEKIEQKETETVENKEVEKETETQEKESNAMTETVEKEEKQTKTENKPTKKEVKA